MPQGGVLSPYLWLLHIDKLFAGMKYRRNELIKHLPLTSANFLDSPYADDILRAITHPNTDVLVQASRASATAYEGPWENWVYKQRYPSQKTS